MRKLTKQEQEVILDACDLYGLNAIKYYDDENTMYVFYSLTKHALKMKDKVIPYLQEKIPTYTWQVMSTEEWNMRWPMPNLLMVFNRYEWGREVLCDD